MPELPEVETIRRGLERLVVGYTVKDVEIRYKNIFHGDPTLVTDAEILAVRRYGKGLLIDFANGYSLAIHVKMTGQLIFKTTETTKEFHPRLPLPLNLPDKHTHAIFELISLNSEVGNARLFYNDIRKFGWLKVVRTDQASELPFFKNLGLEPLSSLTVPAFNHILSSSNAPIKSLLMDQQKIAGVGNIYANDALYASQIDPRRPAKSLSEKEAKALFEAVEKVLRKGIEAGGASDVNYLNADGTKGSYQNHFLVYKKTGKPCPRCGTPIEKIQLAGRGTFFCSRCQK